jgi:diguanylate cyclase (GGDEF)-like protein
VPMAVACALLLFSQSYAERMRRPEFLLVSSWAVITLMITAAVLLAHGPRIFLLAVFYVPVFAASVTFPVRVVAVGTALTVAVTAGLALVIADSTVFSIPSTITLTLAAVVSLAMLGCVSSIADAASRNTAVVDQLTGVLNRTALEARVVELAHQAATTGSEVAVVIGDLDEFKAINDEHGHAVGDAVLREVATRLQTALGGGETVYRFGGEEFVVLLPGLDARAAASVAERLRHAISSRPIEGLTLTISFGVTASVPDDPFDYRTAFGYADAALYDAKDAGRDRVSMRDASHGPQPVRRDPSGRNDETGSIGEPAFAPLDAWDGHLARERSEVGSLLVDSTAQREHMLDLNDRIGKVREITGLLIFAAILTAVPTIGWFPLVPIVIFGTFFNVSCKVASKRPRPEYLLLIAALVAQAGYGLNFILSAGDPLVALAILALVPGGVSAVYPPRSTAVSSAATAVIMVVVAFVVNTHEVLHNPAILACPLAVLGSLSLIGAAVGRSAVDHRSAAIVDRLTGMLSRVALEARVAELTHRAATTGERASLIVGDVDHFKAINDRYGHAAGDTALKEIARQIVDQLRAFEPVYRIGGEEFLVVLTGVDVEGARVMAERLRVAVGKVTVDGTPLTMSLGVSGSSDDEPFDYTAVFERADAALYEAKVAGRNRVCVRGDQSAVAQPALIAA